jgi:hypothetical protein
MEKTNVRKNPFGPNTSNMPEPIRNTPSSKYHNEPPIKSHQSSSNVPPPKNVINNRENEPHNQTRPIGSNIPTFTTNQNNENENLLREYENIKIYNSSKGFMRPTTER